MSSESGLAVARSTEPTPAADAAGDVVVAARDVSKCYGIYARPIDRLKQTLWRGRRQFYREFWALRSISFEVRRGESIGIIGRNGSGKSTLLQIIAGTLRPTTGEVRVRGRVAALLELGSGFNPEFTGRENVFLNGSILGLPQREIERRFADIAAFADIGDFIEMPVKTYSTGMLVRLAFAVQAQLEPDLLIIDEALAVGDEKFQRKCYNRLEELRARGASVLLVTHSTSAVEKYCQKAILLDKGEMHGFRASKDIVDQYHALLYADEQAYLRLLNAECAATSPPPAAAETAPAAETVCRPGSGEVGLTTTRAQIARLWMADAEGVYREWFNHGEEVEIGFELAVHEDLAAIQGGIRLRTVEGVPVFGSNTSYAGRNLSDVPAGSCCVVRFRMRLDLCEGTYFVTLAAAEPQGAADMRYLDKRTDVLVLHVREHPVTAVGIAHLHARIETEVRPQNGTPTHE